jgi:hypothetical protein
LIGRPSFKAQPLTFANQRDFVSDHSINGAMSFHIQSRKPRKNQLKSQFNVQHSMFVPAVVERQNATIKSQYKSTLPDAKWVADVISYLLRGLK